MGKKVGGLHIKDCPPALQARIQQALDKDKLTRTPQTVSAYLLVFVAPCIEESTWTPPIKDIKFVAKMYFKFINKYPNRPVEIYEVQVEA